MAVTRMRLESWIGGFGYRLVGDEVGQILTLHRDGRLRLSRRTMVSELPDRVLVTETVQATVLPDVAAEILDTVSLFARRCELPIMDVTPWTLELSRDGDETVRL